mmetsp:Transcript_54/g.85  ORF Transcript_54/g.85 Transcript_54/m.85 type:complete len:301 (+) Transcript_54:123-1025(+)
MKHAAYRCNRTNTTHLQSQPCDIHLLLLLRRLPLLSHLHALLLLDTTHCLSLCFVVIFLQLILNLLGFRLHPRHNRLHIISLRSTKRLWQQRKRIVLLPRRHRSIAINGIHILPEHFLLNLRRYIRISIFLQLITQILVPYLIQPRYHITMLATKRRTDAQLLNAAFILLHKRIHIELLSILGSIQMSVQLRTAKLVLDFLYLVHRVFLVLLLIHILLQHRLEILRIRELHRRHCNLRQIAGTICFRDLLLQTPRRDILRDVRQIQRRFAFVYVGCMMHHPVWKRRTRVQDEGFVKVVEL